MVGWGSQREARVAEPSLRSYSGRLGPAASLPPRDPSSLLTQRRPAYAGANSSARTVSGVTARRHTPVRPGPPSPSIRAHSSATCNSTTHPSCAAPLSQGPARKLRCDPTGRRELAIEAGLVVRRHNARTGDWCSRPSWSRSCATDD